MAVLLSSVRNSSLRVPWFLDLLRFLLFHTAVLCSVVPYTSPNNVGDIPPFHLGVETDALTPAVCDHMAHSCNHFCVQLPQCIASY